MNDLYFLYCYLPGVSFSTFGTKQRAPNSSNTHNTFLIISGYLSKAIFYNKWVICIISSNKPL